MAGSNLYTRAISHGILDARPDLLVHVPSSHAAPMIRDIEASGIPCLLANKEDEAVGIAGGAVLAGARAVLIMQDNGFGNALTALTTFAAAYHVGLPIIANTRGGLGEYNSMIHSLCESVPEILRAARLTSVNLSVSSSPDYWRSTVQNVCTTAGMTRRPVIALADLLHPAIENAEVPK